ncbi:MAG: bifunctional riboflavin kinase/FAD synthetase [Nitrospira sp.]|nr:bifunctional riboflavin kinase/FAD synthetase [Nitrospira sp.]
MKVSRGLPTLPLPPNPVLTIGNFDGQHIGHRQLLAAVVQCAREQQGTPMVLTFDPHPVLVLSPGNPFQFLTSPSEKLAWFEGQGVEHLVVLNFTTTFAALSPREFVYSILRDGLGVKDLFVGEHFVFGKDRAGNTEILRDLAGQAGFRVHLVKPVSSRETVVSSTRIRQFIRTGKLEEAMQCLGRPYSLKGTVIEGAHRGEQLGCQTANLRPEKDRVLPPDGVYATKMVWQEAVFPAVSYIGTRPTFGEGERLLEVHVLDADCDLYGQPVEVQFLQYIRGDERFEDAAQLAERIAQDIQRTRRVLTE